MKNDTASLYKSGKLSCPVCRGPLDTDLLLECKRCNICFPCLGDIPVLVKKPDLYISSWVQQFRNFIQQQQISIQHEQQLIASSSAYPPVRERLGNVVKAKMENLQTIANLMVPLRDCDVNTIDASNVTSSGQFSSPHYLFRDWAWETKEPEVMCNTVVKILPSDLGIESLLIIGSGGCRESLILHNHYNCPFTVSTDIDPFKILAASHIISGGELNLYQIFQNNIRNAHDNVSYWTLRSKTPLVNTGFYYILSDASDLPIAKNSFHVVFTPFIIDEIGEDLRTFSRKIHHLIQPGGYWVNYGVMTFRPEVSYTGEEVLSIVEEAGFRILEHGYEKKLHVAPEENCLHQLYDCLYFSATKKA